MKRMFFYILAAMSLVLGATNCDQETGEPDNGQQKEQPKVNPGSFKFVASDMKGRWVAGDKIYVHGALGTDAQVITLSAGDISADGKTATAKLDQVTATPLNPDLLYAAWPDEAVQHNGGIIGTKFSFNDCERLLMTAYLSGDSFVFKDVCSAITFTLDGGYDGYAIASGSREGMNISRIEVDHTSAKNTRSSKNDGYPFKYGSVENGKETFIWFPGDFTFTGGYTIFLSKDGKWCATYSVSADVTLPAGKPQKLGDISSKIAAYNGPAPKMPVMGSPTKYSVEFNELSGLCLSADEDFLWAIDDNGRIGKLSFAGEVIWKKSFDFDPEAITLDPVTGDLLVGNEEPCAVYRIASPDFNKADHLFTIPGTSSYGNSGIEGLTYYKDGKVYAGAQANSHLFCCDLATGTVLWDKKMYNKKLVSEIADLFYDPLTDWLWIIDSEAKKIFVFTGDAENLLGAYSVTGISNPESVCVDHKHGCVWVGDDYGETSYLYKYPFEGLDDAIIE